MLRWVLPAILSGIVALLSCFPMRWAAGWFLPDNIEIFAPNLDVRGTIWRGTISGLPLFGSANLEVTPLSRRVDFQSGLGKNYISGTVSPSHAQDIDFQMDLATIPLTDGRLQGLQGQITAQIAEMQIVSNACLSSTGTVRTDVLQRNGGTIQWTGPELAGPIRCEDGAMIVDLSGQDAQQSISALISIVPDGTYRADINVRTARAEADAVLPLFGFSRSGQSFVLTEQGKWR